MYTYAYLVGTLLLGAAWFTLYLLRKDLRRAMVWSGTFNLVFITVGFVAYHFVVSDPSRAITPGYWAPPTLFDLGQKTQGYGIEDALYLFFSGGIAAALYETVFRRKISIRKNMKLKKRHALWVGLLGTAIFHYAFHLNNIYILIMFNFCGALAIMWQRRDLITQSILSGLLFLVVYTIEYLIFNMLFPDFVTNYYNLYHTSGVMLLGIPLEEYLYAATFGRIWAPIYEYEHKLKDVKFGQKTTRVYKRRTKSLLRWA
jgi:hypothetical protein